MPSASGPARVWFYRPRWFWFGLSTLSPIHYYPYGDEFGRATLALGWPVTGRTIVALTGKRWEYNYDEEDDVSMSNLDELDDMDRALGITLEDKRAYARQPRACCGRPNAEVEVVARPCRFGNCTEFYCVCGASDNSGYGPVGCPCQDNVYDDDRPTDDAPSDDDEEGSDD